MQHSVKRDAGSGGAGPQPALPPLAPKSLAASCPPHVSAVAIGISSSGGNVQRFQNSVGGAR